MLALFISPPSLSFVSLAGEHKQLFAKAAIGQLCMRTPRVWAPRCSFLLRGELCQRLRRNADVRGRRGERSKMRAEAAAFLFPRATDDAMSFREVVASRPWGSSRGAKPVQLVDNADHVTGPAAAAAPVWMTNGGCGGYYHCRQCQMGVSMVALSPWMNVHMLRAWLHSNAGPSRTLDGTARTDGIQCQLVLKDVPKAQ